MSQRQQKLEKTLATTQVFVMITKIFWQTFWRNKWTPVFGVVKDSSYIGKNIFTTNLDKYINKIVFLKCIISYHFIGGVGAIEVTVTPPAFGDTISVSASKIVFSIAFVFRTLRDKKNRQNIGLFTNFLNKNTTCFRGWMQNHFYVFLLNRQNEYTYQFLQGKLFFFERNYLSNI